MRLKQWTADDRNIMFWMLAELAAAIAGMLLWGAIGIYWLWPLPLPVMAWMYWKAAPANRTGEASVLAPIAVYIMVSNLEPFHWFFFALGGGIHLFMFSRACLLNVRDQTEE